MCGEGSKTTLHTLVKCEETRWMWHISLLRIDIDQGRYSTFREWCGSFIKLIKDDHWWDLFWSILWGVWLWLFENKKTHPDQMMSKVVSRVNEFKEAQGGAGRKPKAQSRKTRGRKPLEEGRYKLNTNADVFNDGKIGCGGVLRDSEGM